MTDRKLVYRIEVNTGQAKSEAKAFASQIKAELSNIKINVLDGRAFAGADAKIAKLRTELQSLSTVQPPKITVDDAPFVRITERANEFKRELERVEAQAKRVGQAVEQSNRQQAKQRQPAVGGGAGGGLGGFLGGAGNQLLGLAGISLSVAGIASLTQELATLRKESLLATTAFTQLSGGASQANARLSAMKQAAGGTLTTMEALRSANQITALGMASTAEGFGRITQAARAVTFISPVIHDIGSAITELSLASANLSFRRLDQLGLSVSEVKDKMAELQSANAGMSDNTAFLEASVSTLIDKFGGLTNSAAAQAKGIDKLKISWAEFQRELAEGGAGELADKALGGTADFINKVSTFIGVGSGETIQKALEAQVKDLLSNASLLESIPGGKSIGLGKAARDSAKDLEIAAKIQKQANDAIAAGAPGAANYAAQIEGITTSISRWGFASDEQIQQLNTLSASLASATPALTAFGAGVQSVSDTQSQAAEQAEALAAARKSLTEAVADKATDVIGSVGSQKATELVKQQLEKVDQLIADFEARGVKGIELDIAIAANLDGLTEVFDSVEAAAQQQLGQNIAATLSDSLARGMVEANNAAFDGSTALSGYREELAALAIEIANSGFATEEQAARVRELTGVFDAAANSSSVYSALQSEQGQALLASNVYASELATQITALDAAQATGAITAEQHAGALSVLVGQLIAVAQQAGITGSALAGLQAIQAGLNTTPTNGFNRGATAGNAINAALAAQEATRQRAEQRRAAEQAAREQEQAAKRAGRELESAAKRAGKALESSLQGVEGLFGLSKVSQKDLDLAAAGGNVNFADDFVRRFRDLVDNGILHDGAGVEEVKRALQNIGIKPADDIKLLLGQLETAWQNSSLFANKDNLALINKDAVQQSLDLQAKMEDGRNNIMAFFGVTIDAATGAVDAASATNTAGEDLKTAVTDGQKKIADHLIATTGAAVDAATGAQTQTTTATGAIQITNVTIAPTALEGLFAGITAPTITITSVTIEKGVGATITTELAAEIAKQTDLLFGVGGGIASQIQLGIEGQDFAPAGVTIVEEIKAGIASPANVQLLFGMGGGIAGFIQLGLDEYDFAPSGSAILDDVSAGLKSPESLAKLHNEGAKAASELRIGFDGYAFNDVSTGVLDDIAAGLSTPESAERMAGIGDATAAFIRFGIDDYDFSLASPAILDELRAGLVAPQSLAIMSGIGGGIASFVHLGILEYDFGPVGNDLINSISTGITSESSIGTLTNTGKTIADALYNGFAAQIPNADWVGGIVAAVIAQLNAGVQQTQ